MSQQQQRPRVFAMHRRTRVDGQPFLVAIVPEQLVLEPGTELHLRRVRLGDDGDEPTHALQTIPPREPFEPTRAKRQRLAADDLTGSAIRIDPRDSNEEPAPW